MNFSNNLKDKLKIKYGTWALVTGASSGIGKEIAERLAESGLNLILVARRKNLLEEFSANLQSKYTTQLKIIEKDLSNQTEVFELIKNVSEYDIGLVVLSAGFGISGQFFETKIEDEVSMLQVNCLSLLILSHHFNKKFIAQKRGGIILMSSIVAFQGVPYAANYAATKAYVQSLAEALYIESKPYGVAILSAAPGPVNSGFEVRANMKMNKSLKPEKIGIAILKALGRKQTVYPGFLTKFLVGSLRTAPRALKVRIMKLVMGGMTKHQRDSFHSK
jgi:short-subunit dehydrogenase